MFIYSYFMFIYFYCYACVVFSFIVFFCVLYCVNVYLQLPPGLNPMAINKCKRYISPITGSRYPKGSRKFRFPDYVTLALGGGKFVSLRHRPLFSPRKYTSYSFLLEAKSTPEP